MVDNQQLQQIRQATGTVVSSLHDTNQVGVEILTTMQDRTLQFAQNTFINWMELLTRQIESTQYLQQQWEQQARRQQNALLKLMSCSMELSMNTFLTPFSFARHEMEATEDMLRSERDRIAR